MRIMYAVCPENEDLEQCVALFDEEAHANAFQKAET